MERNIHNMEKVRSLFIPRPGDVPARIAICMSGAGSNAEVILSLAASGASGYVPVVIFTDNPEASGAAGLSAKYNVPMEHLDIRAFYREHGEDDIQLNSEKRRQLRNIWSEKVWQILQKYQCDFAVFAGFVPLTNLADKLPCLNVHPGDLTLKNPDGSRRYAGLHCKPVEKAVLDRCKFLRSSVILVQSYSGSGQHDLDGGPVLGISAPVQVDLHNSTYEELETIYRQRGKAPFNDRLRQIALGNIENLKIQGDHVVFPQVISLFAKGCYASDDDGRLFFRESADGRWNEVETVEFAGDDSRMIRPAAEKIMPEKKNKLLRFCKYLYVKMVRGNGSPDYIARGWALGMFVGCVIPVFCQLIVAVPMSFVIRGSKIGAALGTFITTPPTAIFIYPVQIWVGNKIIGGDLSADSAGKLLSVFNNEALSFAEKWSAFADMGWALVAAFFAGGLLWAAIMTPATYFGVRYLVIRYRNIRKKIFESIKKERSRA
ncbi:MAG: DUF2062 domain-containing protein [Lentisphaerae bacterium]|nr:DUF2062 domain-containing protein [Lentisphaerota bacterium]